MHAGGPAQTVARLRDPGLRERLRVRDGVGGAAADAAAEAGRRPIDFYCELLADEELGAASIAHIGNEENVRTIMTHPAHTAGSDGILVGERPHPRSWGTFPRYLGAYVRELAVL